MESWQKIAEKIQDNPIDLLLIGGNQAVKIKHMWLAVIEQIKKANGKKVMIVVVSLLPEKEFIDIQKDDFLSEWLRPEEIEKKLSEIIQKLNIVSNEEIVSEKT